MVSVTFKFISFIVLTLNVCDDEIIKVSSLEPVYQLPPPISSLPEYEAVTYADKLSLSAQVPEPDDNLSFQEQPLVDCGEFKNYPDPLFQDPEIGKLSILLGIVIPLASAIKTFKLLENCEAALFEEDT